MRTPRDELRRRRNRALATPNTDGSPLEGYVEHPTFGTAVERHVAVSGWHAWDRLPVAAVTVEVDGVVLGRARADRPRDDIAAARDDLRYASTGWVADVDLGAVQDQTVTLAVTVFPAADHAGVRLDPVTVTVLGVPTIDAQGMPIPAPPEVLGNIDVPAEGALIEAGPMSVKGWARATYAPASHVELFADELALGPARIAVDRADVAADDPDAHAPICGFEQLVDLSALEVRDGTVTIRAAVTALDGTVGELVRTVRFTSPTRARVPVGVGALDQPRATNGALDLLVVTHDLGYGGAQLWLAELLSRARAGSAFACTVVAFAGGALAATLEAAGIEVHVTTPLPVSDVVAYEGRLAELSAWLDTKRHTAALVNTFRAFPGADLAARRGLPAVWAIHESWPEELIWAFDHPGVHVDTTVRELAARALGAAGAVIFESDATRTLYEPRAPGRTLVVPYGVDTAAMDRIAAGRSKHDARRSLGIDEDARVLLVMGTIEPRKGQALLAEAFVEVADAHPDAVLVFVGDLATPYSGAIREYLVRAGIDSRARIEPVTDDAATWYLASDALVCCSDVESLPRSVLDAMAMGLPVVATRVFGIAELLVDAETALLFEPLDLAGAVGALDRVLSMPAGELAAIADQAHTFAHNRLDSAGYAHDVVALLRGLMADPAATPAAILAESGRTADTLRG